MKLKLKHDFFDRPVVPSYLLCKSNKERIGVIQCTAKTIAVKFNSMDEINFTTYLYINGEKNRYYNDIDVLKYILLPDIGFFAIDSVQVQSEGTELEHKEVTAKSYECLLGQKYLDVFSVNMGTTGSIDGVQLYNMAEPAKSLLHIALEKCPDWRIGHIDTALRTMQRSFEITKQDVYTFLTTDVSEAFECIFLFDTLNNTINVYQEKNVGHDTDIYVSYRNLLKSTNITCSISDIKTCLTLTGENDLNIREVNMGYDKIYNLSYFHSTRFMSQSLFDAYNDWLKKREGLTEAYTNLLSQYQNYNIRIYQLEHLKMPDDPESTVWSEYGLEPLKEKQKTYEQTLDVMMKSGWGDPESENYEEYLNIYHIIEEIREQINRTNRAIQSIEREQAKISYQMTEIVKLVSMNANFTPEQLKELTTFIREDELNTSNFVVTDNMTEEERFSMLHEFLTYGENELAKAAVPQLSFDADMANLFTIPEFQRFCGEFDVGNYIYISMRDDYKIKARLLSMTIDFYDVSNFSVTFGNLFKHGNMARDFTNAFKQAQSAATSVSFQASNWNRSSQDTFTIGKILDEGLLSAGKYLKSGDDSEMIIDSRGIFINTTSGDYAGKDAVFIGGGRILFTDDNWQTVSMSVGRADVTIKGAKESRFGTFADFVIAGYIGGSTLEGDEIYGGKIQSKNYDVGKSGTLIDLEEGTFELNAGGEQKLTLDEEGVLTVKGTVKAEEGYIGGATGFTLEENKLYNGKTSISDTADGIYLGTDGIALGSDNVFKVTPQGVLTAKYGEIAGAVLNSNSIRASNNMWWIHADGSSSFEHVYINGVQNGSQFGSVIYNHNITSGIFGGVSSFGSTAAAPFKGTCVEHIESLAVGRITADYINAKLLECQNLFVNGKIKAGLVDADNITTGTLSVDRIDLDGLIGKYVYAQGLGALDGFSFQGTQVKWVTETINGKQYRILAAV